jgi:hypothetical protein
MHREFGQMSLLQDFLLEILAFRNHQSASKPQYTLPILEETLRVCSVISIPYGLDGIGKNMKDFDLFGIKTHPIPLNPHGLRAKRTTPYTSLSSDGGSP